MRGSILKTRVLVLSVVLAGCGTVPAPFMPNALDGIVAEVVAAARAPAAEQAAALARAEKAAASGTPADRLRLATLLATLGAPLRDDARAGELLQSVTEGSMGRFAALLSSQIAERQRLSREVERVSREAERLGRDAERSAREHDKREEALKQQIEALRAIERNIREREEKLRTRPR